MFSCLVEPTPPGPVTYQWRVVNNVYGYVRSIWSQNFSDWYSRYDHLQYAYYFCLVSVNDIPVGSASKMAEIQGKSGVIGR